MKIITILLALGLAASSAVAQTAPLSAPRVEGEMRTDGVLDEAFWQQAAVTTLDYETRPGENIPASVKTTVRIVDSGASLRVAFEAEDPDPNKIRAYLRDRDSAYDDDFVGFNLDTFDSQQRAFEFYVNALGAQMDLIYEESNGNEDSSWDGLWSSAGKIHDKGYTVEIEIPYSTLRFQHREGPQQWTVDFVRFRPRDNRFRYSNNKQDRNNNCYLCGLGKITGFAHADPGKNILVNPTLTTRYTQSRSTPNAAFVNDGPDVEAGLDVSWSPTPNHTLNGTINPDFSQVESDGAQLNVNTTFALFFPEKRPFFLENADYFSTPYSLVYTRNVADPDIGLRATGRVNNHAYGVFATRDTVTNFLRPGPFGSRLASIDSESDDFVGAYRYNFTATSNIGGLLTHRSGEDYSNNVGSIDGRWQKGAHSLVAQFIHTDTEDAGSFSTQPFTGNGYYANYSFNTREKSFRLIHQQFDPGFRADMGFVGQVDYRKSVIGGGYRWYPKNSFFNQINLNGDWDITHQVSNGQLLEREIEAYLGGNGRKQSYLEVGAGTRVRFWRGNLFDETFYTAFGEFTPIAGLRLSLFHRGGDQIDFANNRLGKTKIWEPGITANIGRGLSVNLSGTYQSLDAEDVNVFTAKLIDLRVSYQFNLQQRLRLTVQASDVNQERETGTQLVYSYKVNPRTVFYAGYSDSYGDDVLTQSFQSDRSLFLKFSYAWQP